VEQHGQTQPHSQRQRVIAQRQQIMVVLEAEHKKTVQVVLLHPAAQAHSVLSSSKNFIKPVYFYTVMEKMPLTDEQIEAIAERAAEVAFKKIYEEVGRSVVKRVFWIVGAGSLALLFWLAGNGHFPKV
jgi:hypothetical protein